MHSDPRLLSCHAGAAVADINQPILPGADVTSKDLPDGPKPLDALRGAGLGGIGDKVTTHIACVCNHMMLLHLFALSHNKVYFVHQVYLVMTLNTFTKGLLGSTFI